MALVKQFSGEFGSPCKHACVGIHFRARLKMENVFVNCGDARKKFGGRESLNGGSFVGLVCIKAAWNGSLGGSLAYCSGCGHRM
jgi:hypothetical protein